MKKYKHRATFRYNGKRYSVYADTLMELGQKKAMKMAALENEAVKESNITLRDYGMRCIELYKTGQSDITRKKYVQRVKKSIFEELGDYKISIITPDMCQHVLNKLKGMSRTHINEVYQALKFIFAHAEYDKIIKSDPTKMLTKPKGTTNHRRALTELERTTLLSIASTDRRYYVFLLMLLCGCRPSEAESCKGADIMKMQGKNMLHIRGTKTATSDRYVPIPDMLYDIIKDIPKNEYISITAANAPVTYDNRKRIWHSMLRQMNIAAGAEMYRNAIITPVFPRDLTPYCLRHDYCTRLAKAGVDIRTAQKLMGHATINMTANIYTHVDNDDLIAAADVIDATLGATLGEKH